MREDLEQLLDLGAKRYRCGLIGRLSLRFRLSSYDLHRIFSTVPMTVLIIAKDRLFGKWNLGLSGVGEQAQIVCGDFGGDRDREVKSRALANRALEPDPPALQFHERTSDRQP